MAHTLGLAPLGGVEVCTLQDSEALAARGHTIDLLYGFDGPLREEYETSKVRLHGSFAYPVDPRHPLRTARRLAPAARLARDIRPDVLWLNRIEHLLWGQSVARAARAALVAHLHGPPVFNRMSLLGTGVDAFVAVSDFVRNAYLERGVPTERITTIPNAVRPSDYPVGGPAERAEARDRLGLPADVPVVLCYGQMTVEKGLLVLLKAWHEVIAKEPEALLVLVDAASDRPDPRVQQSLGLLPATTYRVFPRSTDVVPYLHAADVVAFPTLLPEAFGRVVLEGMSTGRPVVASAIGAVPELLPGAMARFLVEPGDSDELAATLLPLLCWRDDEPDLSTACADWVGRNFPFEAHVDKLERILALTLR